MSPYHLEITINIQNFIEKAIKRQEDVINVELDCLPNSRDDERVQEFAKLTLVRVGTVKSEAKSSA